MSIFYIISRIINYLFYYISHMLWFTEKKEDDINLAFLHNYNFKINRGNKTVSTFTNSNKLRCCTWNIHYGYDVKRNFVIPDIINYLINMDFDIIFLQEINNKKTT